MPTDALARKPLWRIARIAGPLMLAAGTSFGPAHAGSGEAGRAGPLKVIQIPIRTDGPKSLDPVKGSTQYDNQATCQIFETLLQVKYLARPLDVEPLLLTEMPKLTDNPDGTQTWLFKLRTDVRFQDDECFPGGKGRTMVAKDVFYSWKRLADPEYELENWWIVKDCIVGFDQFQKEQGEAVKAGKKFDYNAPVAGFKEISDHEFEIVLTKPVTKFRWVLTQFQTSIVPREAVEKYGSRFGVHPVGSGPFTCREGDWKPGENMVLNRNPNYHDDFYPSECEPEDKAMGFDKPAGSKLPLVDRVEVTFYVPDPPMWTDFELGKIGFTQVPAEYFDKAFIKRTRKLRDEYAKRGIVSHAVNILDFIFRGFNMEDPIVGGYTPEKKALRQAINLAYDLDLMNESFYNGTNTVYDGPIPPGLDGFPPDGDAPISYRGPDIQRAKELLVKAGYPGGKGLPELVYYTSRGGNNAEQTQMEQRFFSSIGITINPRLVDFSELIDAVNKKKAPIFSFAWGSDYPDAENNLALFYSPNKAPGANHYNYSNPEYDKLYEKIVTMQPGPERTKIYEQMRDIIIEDCPYIGSQARIRYWLVNPWLKNFKPSEDFFTWVKYLDVDDTKRKSASGS